MNNVSYFYTRDVRNHRSATGLIEPAMILILAALVLWVACRSWGPSTIHHDLQVIDYGRRRAASIAPEAVTVYHWEGFGITDTFVFDADDAGLSLFDRYLTESDKSPSTCWSMWWKKNTATRPSPISTARSARGARAQARVVLPRHALHSCPAEGRETEGRRDDKVLLSAITNPELVHRGPLCVQQKVPVAASIPWRS